MHMALGSPLTHTTAERWRACALAPCRPQLHTPNTSTQKEVTILVRKARPRPCVCGCGGEGGGVGDCEGGGVGDCTAPFAAAPSTATVGSALPARNVSPSECRYFAAEPPPPHMVPSPPPGTGILCEARGARGARREGREGWWREGHEARGARGVRREG